MDNIYYKSKYIKYKQKYVTLKNKNIQIGGKYNKNKNNIKIYEKNVLNDLYEIYGTLTTNITEIKKNKNITRQSTKQPINKNVYSRIKKIQRKLSRSVNKIDENKIFTMTDVKYNFDKKIELKDKYLEQYKKILKNACLSKDLYDTGFYEYQFKLKQYLSECGENRTTQLYGTCWFNVIINAFIFGDHMRARIIQILMLYKKIFGKNKLDRLVERIDKTQRKLKTKSSQKQKLNNSQDTIEYNIFEHIIGILYKILCQEGLRNTDPKSYDNFNLTNLALSIKMLGTNEPTNPKKLEDIAYISIYGIDILINILNKFIDTHHHIIYDENNKYLLGNPNHINTLFIILNNDFKKSEVIFSLYYDLKIQNIELNINDNDINQYIKFNDGIEIKNIKNVDFIFIDYEFYDVDKIPHELYCIVNDRKYLFKLDVSILDLTQEDNNIGHVISGMICNDEYYIYDSQTNFYFDGDWTNIGDIKNVEKFLNFYDIYSASYVYKDIEIKDTSNKFFQLYDKKTLKKSKIKYKICIYYNTHLDFSYDPIECIRHRKE